MVVNVVGAQHGARELLQQIIFFVGGAIGADHAERLPAVRVLDLLELFANQVDGFFPGCGLELALAADHGLLEAARVVRKIEGVASLDAQEIAVDAALVAVVAAHDVHAGVGAPHAQRGLAAVAAVSAHGADVVHLPGARLVAVGAAGERAHGADVNAHAALFAPQGILLVGRDHLRGAAVLDAQRPHVHGFAADAHAAVAHDAARPVEVDHRRPLLLVAMVLDVNQLGLGGAVGERHVLELALAAGIAHRAIQGMVAEQHLQHRFARLPHFVVLAADRHAFADHRGARGLQLRHLLDPHQAHAARALQRQPRVITERGDLDARRLAGFDQQRARRGRDLLAVNRDVYVSHDIG